MVLRAPRGVCRSRCALGIACVLLAVTMASSAPELQPGFELTTSIPSSVFTGIETIAWAPDGTLWIGQSGPGEGMHIWIWRDGVATRVHSFPWIPTGEQGLHTIAVDPDYLENGRLWTYRTTNDPVIHNRVSYFTNPAVTALKDDSHDHADDLVDEVIVLEGPEIQNVIHNGGCMAFASDKTLFVGSGDDNLGSATAQDPHDLRGKILHLNRDGSGAADTPYQDGISGDPRVWALGFRNPFRCNLQPGLDNLFITDVGGSSWEEIDIGIPGGNFGWAAVEGPNPPALPGFVYPIYSYSHDAGDAAVIGGDHAEPGDFTAEYEGDYFFGDWARSNIYRMVLDSENNPVSVELFAGDIGRVTDIEFGPDGAMYISARNTSGVSLRRIEYIGGTNRQPDAVGVASQSSGSAPLQVTLDGLASSDPDDDPLTYDWALGDGTVESGAIVEKLYPQGVYEAVLTVDDGNGLTDVAPPIRIVSGNFPPTATVTAPAGGTTYDAGQTIAYSGQGDDLFDGSLPCSQFSWQVSFHHGTHAHPFLGPEQGNCGGMFTIPNRGETAPNVWYRMRFKVEDSGEPIGPEGSLVDEQVLDIFPNTSILTFESAPVDDLQLTLDTAPLTPPLAVESVTGMLRDVGTPGLQLGSNNRWYRWLSWSDGGAEQHTVATPVADTTLTASFACVPDELTDVHINPDGDELVFSWSQESPHCFAVHSLRYRIYAASSFKPAVGDGVFPDDPAFRLVGTSPNRGFRYVPEPDDVYFLLVGSNPQGQLGLLGHYGQ